MTLIRPNSLSSFRIVNASIMAASLVYGNIHIQAVRISPSPPSPFGWHRHTCFNMEVLIVRLYALYQNKFRFDLSSERPHRSDGPVPETIVPLTAGLVRPQGPHHSRYPADLNYPEPLGHYSPLSYSQAGPVLLSTVPVTTIIL